MANIPLQSISFPGLSDKYTTPTVDATLTQTGAAADAKKTGDEIAGLKNDLSEKADKTDAYSAYIVETETGSIASFTDGADDVPVKDLTIAIEPVQSGSGDPSPSNVRPISGWTGANVSANGINQWDEVWESGFINSNGENEDNPNYFRSKNYIPVVPGATYYNKCPTSYSDYARFKYYDQNKQFVSQVGTSTLLNHVFTVPSDVYYMRFTTGEKIGAGTVYNHDISINYPATDTDYHAYNGSSVSVDWQTEAGTVYGGTLDVTTGVLTVTHGVLNLADLAWSGLDAKSRRYINMASVIKNHSDLSMVADIISDTYQTVANNTLYNDTSAIGIAQNDGFIFIRTPDNEVPSGVLVYPLLAPTTVQLTAQEVSTILGQNNIFADTGDSTVQYRADTKLYIDKVLSA